MRFNNQACLTASLLACTLSAFAGVQICELHPNTCPPGTAPMLAAPVGDCPQNTCESQLPRGSILCNDGICNAYPQGISSALYYRWRLSNNSVSITPYGAQLHYSCAYDSYVLISVVVSDSSSAEQLAQQLVLCRSQTSHAY